MVGNDEENVDVYPVKISRSQRGNSHPDRQNKTSVLTMLDDKGKRRRMGAVGPTTRVVLV